VPHTGSAAGYCPRRRGTQRTRRRRRICRQPRRPFHLRDPGKWEPDESDAEQFRRWVRDAWTRIRPFSTGGNYVNFQTADDDEERIRATYGDNFDRVVEAKTTYDPTNVFRSNRNVRPRTT